ncbi:MAG: TetR/AcrR family transcriptional regulator [Nitriliruptoraceae bacterium]
MRSLVQRAGFEAISHQQVATEAGVGRATVYRHWPKRTDLLLHALADVEAPHEWRSSGDLATDLARELQRLQRTMSSSPLVTELVALIGRAEWDSELRETKAELLASGTAGLRQTLEAAIDRGELPTDHDLDTTIARLAGPLFYRRVLAHAPLEDAFVTKIITAYIHEVSHQD